MSDAIPHTYTLTHNNVLAPEDVYDALMGDIEPDLLTVNIPLLEKKYGRETPVQRALRQARYAKAYEAYDRAFAAWKAQCTLLVRNMRKEALRSAETKSRQEEDALLRQMDDIFHAPVSLPASS